MNGIELIAEERKRQVEQELWTPEHDDEHEAGELAAAGAAYALHAAGILDPMIPGPLWDDGPPAFWRWAREYWKPKNSMRDLVRAGALIAAEIDKLQRDDEHQDLPTGRAK